MRRYLTLALFIVLVLGVFLFGVLIAFVLGMRMLRVFVFAMRVGMFGTLLSDVRGEFRSVDGAGCFDFCGFFFGESGNRFGMNFLVLFSFFFRFVLFENGAA